MKKFDAQAQLKFQALADEMHALVKQIPAAADEDQLAMLNRLNEIVERIWANPGLHRSLH